MACTCQIGFQSESNLRFERTQSCGDPAGRDQGEVAANRRRKTLCLPNKIARKRHKGNSPGTSQVFENPTSREWTPNYYNSWLAGPNKSRHGPNVCWV